MPARSEKNVEIINKTKGALPRVPFVDIKETILGKDYSLSISFVSLQKMKELSQIYKGDPSHTNVLSFPLSKTSGEIVMNLQTIKKESSNFEQTPAEHLKFLVIHGTLHLAGLRHGSKMETQERRLMKKFSVRSS